MTITWPFSHIFSKTAAAETSLELRRWRTLLHWAARTSYYRQEREFLADTASRKSVGSLRAQLVAARPVPLRWFVANAKEFRSGLSRMLIPQRRSTFWEIEGSIALVHPWFQTEEPARSFTRIEPLSKTAKTINRFEPDVLVASRPTLLRLVKTPLTAPKRAIIAIHSPGATMMQETERDALWQRFKVPVYQQLRGFQGELLAAECDAQVGFHANAAMAHWEIEGQELLYTSLFDLRHPVLRLAPGWCGDLETSRCGCGILSPRLFPYESKIFRARAQGAA